MHLLACVGCVEAAQDGAQTCDACGALGPHALVAYHRRGGESPAPYQPAFRRHVGVCAQGAAPRWQCAHELCVCAWSPALVSTWAHVQRHSWPGAVSQLHEMTFRRGPHSLTCLLALSFVPPPLLGCARTVASPHTLFWQGGIHVAAVLKNEDSYQVGLRHCVSVED